MTEIDYIFQPFRLKRSRLVYCLWISIAIAAWTMSGCAKIKSPPGGPIDLKGPIPVTTSPEQGATKVNASSPIEIQFDSRLQKIDPAVVSLSPFPHSGLRVYGKGKNLIVQPLEPLLPATTYRLTISTQLINERGNHMSQPLELVFSTGDSIATGVIRGCVFDNGNSRNIWIWGWRIDGKFGSRFSNFVPEPWLDVPDVVAALDSIGHFELAGLSSGKYRIYAIDDIDKDRRYNPSVDRLGITFGDPILPRDSAIVFSFLLFTRDTIAPQILSARMIAPRIASIRFTRPVIATPGKNAVIRTVDSTRLTGISYQDPTDSTRWYAIFPVVPDRDSLQLQFSALQDRLGNMIPDTVVTKRFPARVTGEDTLVPRVHTITPAMGWVNRNQEWIITSTATVEPGGFQKSITGFNVIDSVKIPVSVQQIDATTARVKPVSDLPERIWFEIAITPKSWKSLTGIAGTDTTIKYRFQILPTDTTGTVHVKVVDEFYGNKGSIVIELIPFNRFSQIPGWSSEAVPATQIVNTDGSIELTTLPGSYRLRAFSDENKNGIPDPGSLRPFQFAEPVTIGSDSIRVRTRWTNEGIRLKLR